MPNVSTTADQATPAWLTATLREARVLPHGEVIAVEQRAGAAFNSTIPYLELLYVHREDAIQPATLRELARRDGVRPGFLAAERKRQLAAAYIAKLATPKAAHLDSDVRL